MKLTKADYVFVCLKRYPDENIKIYSNSLKVLKEKVGNLTNQEMEYVEENRKLLKTNILKDPVLELPATYTKSMKVYFTKYPILYRTPLTKSDYIYILFNRKSTIVSINELSNMQIEKLEVLTGDISYEEKKSLILQKMRRCKYWKNYVKKHKTFINNYKQFVNYNATLAGIPSVLSIETKIDMIYKIKPKSAPSIDEYQQQLISEYCQPDNITGGISNKYKNVCCIAGPGAGKTQTLTEFCRQASINNQSVLCLMFNRNTCQDFKTRLKSTNIKYQKNSNIENTPGIYVLTFHQFAYWKFSSNDSDIFPNEDFNYKNLIKKAIRKMPSLVPFNYIVIDESQDMTKDFQELFDNVKTSRVIYVGDPRQQLYLCSSVFGQLLKSNNISKLELLNNYRSKPEIIQLLNNYSRTNFHKNHHIEQVCPNPDSSDSNSVKIVYSNNCPESIVNHLLEYDPGETFIISPVTTSKFRVNELTTLIRQLAHEQNRHIGVSEHGDISNNDDYICNSYAVKGLERKQIILFAVSDTDLYIDYGVRSNILKCLIYVALSRASHRIVIVINNNKYKSPNLLDFAIDHSLIQPTKVQPRKIPKSIHMVVTDFAKYELPYEFENLEVFNPISFERKYIEDVAGLLVEVNIAKKLDILKNNYQIISKKSKARKEKNKYLVIIDLDPTSKKYDEVIKIISNLISNKNISDAFKYVKIEYCCRVNREWTVSDNLENFKMNSFELDQYLEFIKEFNNNKTITHGESIDYYPTIDRSKETGWLIRGICDFSDEDNVYEIKHAKDCPSHHIQVGIYGLLLGRRSILVNTYEGFAKEIKLNWDLAKLNKYFRCVQLLKIISRYRVGNMNLDIGNVVIIDIENDFSRSYYMEPIIREISAIVVNIESSEIIDIYHKTFGCSNDPDAVVDHKFKDVYELTGLIPLNDNPTYINNFIEFIQPYKNYQFVQWGSNDCKNVGLKNVNSLDLSVIFKRYLEKSSIKIRYDKSKYKLKEAIFRLVPVTLPWVPHRAFDDTLITMLIYSILALTK